MFEDAGAALPEATAILLAVDIFLTSYGWLLLLFAAGLAALFIYSMREPRTRLVLDRFFLNSRLTLGLPSSYEAARFCRSLQTLLEGGLSLESALALARGGSSNSWFNRNLADAQAAVAEGQHLRTALAKSAVLPPLVVEFAAVGEETGRVGPMMGEVAAILDLDVETRLDRLSALVVPVATLILGALVSGIMAGVVSGILAVNDVAR
jgi:general secretion pathway protein F